jgi:cytochrome c oxidase subunit II
MQELVVVVRRRPAHAGAPDTIRATLFAPSGADRSCLAGEPGTTGGSGDRVCHVPAGVDAGATVNGWRCVITNALISTRHEYESLFAIYVPIAGAVFAVLLIAVLFSLLRYRRRQRPSRFSENNRLEATYAAALTLIVAFLLYLTFSAEHRVDTVAAQERPAVTINVTAAKWEWIFTYPAYGIRRQSGTVGRQSLVVPANQAIRFNLTSTDVIHAFYVPELKFKHDVFPGIVQPITVTFTSPGVFPGQCTQFCGLRHAVMVFSVEAVSPQRFRAWAARHGSGTP